MERKIGGIKLFRLAYACIWRRQWHPTPVLLPGKFHGQRNLVGCSPWGHEESDMTDWLHFHFSLSCIGEGNGNPLQCSCLENPRDGGAWWAVVYGVAQSWTRLKWLSSSSSSSSSRVLIVALHYLVSSLLPLTRIFFFVFCSASLVVFQSQGGVIWITQMLLPKGEDHLEVLNIVCLVVL